MSEAEKCRVLHIRASNFYGGPERQILEHVLAMSNSDYSCSVATFSEGGGVGSFEGHLKEHGIRVHRLTMANLLDWLVLGQLLKVVTQEADIVCTHGYKPALLMAALRRKFSGSILAFARGRTREDLKVRTLQSVEEYVYRFFDGVIAVSEAERSRVSSKLPWNSRTWTVHNAINASDSRYENKDRVTSELKGQLDLPTDYRVLVCAGRLSREKGQAVLLNAMPQILKQIDCHLLLCGDGPDRDHLQNLTKALGVDEFTSFMGHCNDMSPFFSLMDCLVLPSLSEGLPNVVLEAMAARRPVVASCVGGVPEVIDDGVTGRLFQPGNPDALAAAVVDVLQHSQIAEGFISRASEELPRRFSFTAQAERLQNIYEEVLSAR